MPTHGRAHSYEACVFEQTALASETRRARVGGCCCMMKVKIATLKRAHLRGHLVKKYKVDLHCVLAFETGIWLHTIFIVFHKETLLEFPHTGKYMDSGKT